MVVLIHQSGPRYLIILTWKSSKVRTCGMICSANYSSKGPGRFYSTLAKEPLNCKRLIRRLNDSVSQTEKEKLRNMPRDMVNTFTLGNRYPVHPTPDHLRDAIASDCNDVGVTSAWPQICGKDQVKSYYGDAPILYDLMTRHYPPLLSLSLCGIAASLHVPTCDKTI